MDPLLDLSTLDWSLTGWRPFAWKLRKSAETGGFLLPDFGPFPARLPGSVQENLRRAGAIPDLHVGRNSLAIEWIEHRQWMFTAQLPATAVRAGHAVFLSAELLDHSGWVLLDGMVAGEFRGAHLPVNIELTEKLAQPGPHELAIVFDLPPEGQGQLGYTSLAREQKPRFSFSWDWCVRVIPIGAGGRLVLESRPAAPVRLLRVTSTLSDNLRDGTVGVTVVTEHGAGAAELQAVVRLAGHEVTRLHAVLASREQRFEMDIPDPELWWPCGEGAQPLYDLEVTVRRDGQSLGAWARKLGFKHIAWRPCAGAPEAALPWLCVVNGRPIFLQGVNWTPVRMCYMDTTREETERLVGLYQGMGCNLLRVWGGGHLETPEFYAACDRAGLLVWQEFPLSSSGMDSDPPRDERFIAGLSEVARHYIRSRQHHACLLQWCGGNELQVETAVGGVTRRQPLDRSHPALAALAQVVAEEDPGHRFLPTSPYGPRFHSSREEFGRGLHHEVHGPWGLEGHPQPGEWEDYWRDDDALFRGETGVAGASSLALIRRHAGGEATWPPTSALWRHSSGWWTQWERLGSRFTGLAEGAALAAYVEYTRNEQAEKLAFAVRAKKAQFPRCGGFLIWMGHDAFPCLANTSIVEFDHTLKPAAHAVAAVFKAQPRSGSPAAP
jgi:beta-mannosidase